MSKYIITALCFGFAAAGVASAHGGEMHHSAFTFVTGNFHPFWVHAPLVLLPLMAVIAVTALIWSKDEWLYVLVAGTFIATISTWLAEKSGHAAGEVAEHSGVSSIAINAHEAAATWLFPIATLAFVASVGALWARRKSRFQTPALTIVVILLSVSTAVVIRAGHLGAILVYGHGAGVGKVFEAYPQSPASRMSSEHMEVTPENVGVRHDRQTVGNGNPVSEGESHEHMDHSASDEASKARTHDHHLDHVQDSDRHTHDDHSD